jgi:hypothetical protein
VAEDRHKHRQTQTDLYSCVVDKATKRGEEEKKKTGNRAWLLAERWFNVRQKVRPFAQAGWLAGWLQLRSESPPPASTAHHIIINHVN